MEILDGRDCPSSEITRDFLSFFTPSKRGFARYTKKTVT